MNSGRAGRRVAELAFLFCTLAVLFVLLCSFTYIRRAIMAKGQQRKNKEAKKPKKKPTPAI